MPLATWIISIFWHTYQCVKQYLLYAGGQTEVECTVGVARRPFPGLEFRALTAKLRRVTTVRHDNCHYHQVLKNFISHQETNSCIKVGIRHFIWHEFFREKGKEVRDQALPCTTLSWAALVLRAHAEQPEPRTASEAKERTWALACVAPAGRGLLQRDMLEERK